MSQINGLDPHGLRGNMTPQTPVQNLENGNPQQSAFDWYQWNLYNGDLASQTLYPGIAQFSEFAQQMVMQQYLNWWNSAPEQMQRALHAGINPYLAANGIAGASTPSVSAPNSAVGAGSQSLSSLINGLGTLGNLASNGIKSFVDLYKMKHEVANMDADTEKKFMDLGFTELQSKALSISLKYLDDKEQIGIWQALADYDKTSQEYNNLVAEHNNILAKYDEIIAQKDLLIATEGEVIANQKLHEAEAAKIQEMTKFMQLERQFFQQHGYKLGTPIYESIRDSIVSGIPLDVISFGNVIAGYQGGLDSVYFNAQASASWKTRPHNAVEMSAWIGGSLGSNLRDLVLKATDSSSLLNMLSKVSNKSELDEFNEAYDDAKSELYSNYRYARKEYRKYSHSGVSDTYKAQLYRNVVDAKKEYDEFTKEKFSQSLIDSFLFSK